MIEIIIMTKSHVSFGQKKYKFNYLTLNFSEMKTEENSNKYFKVNKSKDSLCIQFIQKYEFGEYHSNLMNYIRLNDTTMYRIESKNDEIRFYFYSKDECVKFIFSKQNNQLYEVSFISKDRTAYFDFSGSFIFYDKGLILNQREFLAKTLYPIIYEIRNEKLVTMEYTYKRKKIIPEIKNYELVNHNANFLQFCENNDVDFVLKIKNSKEIKLMKGDKRKNIIEFSRLYYSERINNYIPFLYIFNN